MNNQEFECNQKKQCDSFYVQAFENRKKYIEILKQENSELQTKYDKTLEVLCEYCTPCEIEDFADKNEDYCSKNCSTDEEKIKQCWNRFIEQK